MASATDGTVSSRNLAMTSSGTVVSGANARNPMLIGVLPPAHRGLSPPDWRPRVAERSAENAHPPAVGRRPGLLRAAPPESRHEPDASDVNHRDLDRSRRTVPGR